MTLSPRRKAFHNMLWLFGDKAFRLGFGVFVIVFITRYLGPDKFGAYSYSLSIVSIALCLVSLGLKSIVVKLILEKPSNCRVIVGTSFLLQSIFSLISYFFLYIYVLNFESNNQLLILIMGAVLFFKPSDSLRYYFEANLLSKYSVKVDMFVFVVSSFFKIILVLKKCTLISFAIVFLLESILGFFCFYYLYFREFKIRKIDFNKSIALDLLNKSWPLLISSASWIIYTKIDQLMIGKFLSTGEVGYYAAASQLTDVVVFIPTIITASLIPLTVKYRKIDTTIYLKKFQLIYDLSIGSMFVVAIFVSIFASEIITILYGEVFETSRNILVIHIWSVLFMAMAIVSGQYLIFENKQKVVMIRHIAGIILNFSLNYMLIPRYGIEGAAYSTLLSLFLCNYLSDIIKSSTRICFIQKTKVLFLSGIIHAIREKYQFIVR